MHAELQRLVSIQEVDDEIAELNQSLKIIPGQIASGEKELEGKRSRLNAALEDIDAMIKARNQCEQDVKAEQDHIAKTKSKLPSVKTNKEYTAILTEVEVVQKRISDIEDKELETMEKLEARESDLPELKQEFQGFEAEFAGYKKNKQAEQARTEQELEANRKKRTELSTSVDPVMFKMYDKILNLRGDRAVVPIENEICQGCFQTVRLQMVIEVKTGEKVHQCPQCHRFMYWVPKPEAEEATEEKTKTAVPK